MGYFLGIGASVYLLGILTMQTYQYHISPRDDHKLFKAVVYIVYITEVVCTSDITNNYGYVISGVCKILYKAGTTVNLGTVIGDLPNAHMTKSGICLHNDPLALAVCGGVVAFLVQSMYAYRMGQIIIAVYEYQHQDKVLTVEQERMGRLISKLKYMPWVISLVMALQLIAIVIISGLIYQSLFLVTLIWSSVSLIVDVIILGIILVVWFVILKRENMRDKQFKRAIKRIVYLTIGTSFLTAATNICVLVLSFFSAYYSLVLLPILSKLYANSMMVLINNRLPSDNHSAIMDMLKDIHITSNSVTSQSVADAEHGQRDISVDLEAVADRQNMRLKIRPTVETWDSWRESVISAIGRITY